MIEPTQGTHDPEHTGFPLSGSGFTVYTPAWRVVLSWFFAIVAALTTLLIFSAVIDALRAHEWVLAGLILLFALSPGYQVARSAPVLRTMHRPVEVTVEGVRVRGRKGLPRFTPWSEFGAVREYPFAGVRRYFDRDGTEVLAVFNNATNASLLDAKLQARRASVHGT